jgi:nicotinate phosphoribosyltransferase
MWLMKDSPALFTDLYELTMAQAYFKKRMNETACFEVTIRKLPENWGFFVMAGLAELHSYLCQFQFSKADIEYLLSTKLFSDDFLRYLSTIKPNVKIRSLAEGTVFFPQEPVLELTGPLISAQILESYILNILGFSIIEATLAARTLIAAKGTAVIDFSLRRCQGPIASLRSARAAQIGGFIATSNVFAAKLLDFSPTGTMAHSFVEVHDSEEQSFYNFAETYGQNAILLVDTYDSIEGIKKAAEVAKQFYQKNNIKIKGIRLDSGDLVELSKFARKHFQEKGLPFLKIFASGDLDEFKIHDLLKAGAQIDGFGIGTRFSVSRFAPAIEIVYKIVQYDGKGVFKTSPDKQSRPGQKTITRIKNKFYKKDIVSPLPADSQALKNNSDACTCGSAGTGDLLVPFESPESIDKIKRRLSMELANLPDSIKAIRNPQKYRVEFNF